MERRKDEGPTVLLQLGPDFTNYRHPLLRRLDDFRARVVARFVCEQRFPLPGCILLIHVVPCQHGLVHLVQALFQLEQLTLEVERIMSCELIELAEDQRLAVWVLCHEARRLSVSTLFSSPVSSGGSSSVKMCVYDA